jgi:serine phosphatase RsbU (regulator of sigma subunit)
MPTDDEGFGPTLAVTRPPRLPAGADLKDFGHYLVVVDGSEPGQRVLLSLTPVTIGREAGRDLVLDDGEVSRSHLRVSVFANRVVVEDLNSTNGTFIAGRRIKGSVELPEGALLQLGKHILKVELRSKREVEESQALHQDLNKATKYVHSLLPAPLLDGPVRADWFYLPSTQLGGDAFGYSYLDDTTFIFYLIDVCGHGVGAAMHSVSVLNVLRQRALPETDMRDPASVLAGLNAMFQMDRHDGMYFTIWYGVYDLARRTLRHGSAGHHPSFLVPADRTAAVPLKTPGLMIGADPDAQFRVADTPVAPGSSIYVFSDGAFEIVTAAQQQWRLKDFVPLLLEPLVPRLPESARLYGAVGGVARPGPLDDDFSVLVVTLP